MVTLTRAAEVVADLGSRRYRVVASTDAIARDGMAIPVDAWRLDTYSANPVLLWAHDRTQLPIGSATVTRQADHLAAEIEFAEPGVYDFADTVSRMWSTGLLRAVSVGGSVTSSTAQDDHVRVDSIDLLDISVVPIGADPAALAVARAFDFPEAHLHRLGFDSENTTLRLRAEAMDNRRRAMRLARRATL